MITLVVISGRSGSGKSTALNVLEDMGYYSIDNLPVTLLSPLIERLSADPDINKVAVGIDARNIAGDLNLFPEIVGQFDRAQVTTTIIYLDAASPALLKRFSETRRKHPLSNRQRDLQDALEMESQLLDPISDLAEMKIDTTNLTIHELRDEVRTRVDRDAHECALLFQSFAYKKGVPVDTDIAFDVRCLPNPHWQQALRPLTGIDSPVQAFLEGQQDFLGMFDDICAYLDKWLPKFQANNRSYLTISIGCTGGQHRSVYMCEKLYRRFQGSYSNVQVRHRELHLAVNP